MQARAKYPWQNPEELWRPQVQFLTTALLRAFLGASSAAEEHYLYI